MKCVQVLLPALIESEEQKLMTERCQKSLVSFDNCVKLEVDTKKYDTAVGGVWNNFLSKWRGEEYDYLMITANDTEADPNAIDFMIRCLEENPQAGIVTGKVTRDHDEFKKSFGQLAYTEDLTTGPIDPACFVIRKGVIEAVGEIDHTVFPREFVERDYIWRAKQLGFDTIQPDVVLWYHPPYAGTIGNDRSRLNAALKRYMRKSGGDANAEKYRYPYNDANLDFTFTGEYV